MTSAPRQGRCGVARGEPGLSGRIGPCGPFAAGGLKRYRTGAGSGRAKLSRSAAPARCFREAYLLMGNCEIAFMYWARSNALGSAQFFWLRLPLS